MYLGNVRFVAGCFWRAKHHIHILGFTQWHLPQLSLQSSFSLRSATQVYWTDLLFFVVISPPDPCDFDCFMIHFVLILLVHALIFAV